MKKTNPLNPLFAACLLALLGACGDDDGAMTPMDGSMSMMDGAMPDSGVPQPDMGMDMAQPPMDGGGGGHTGEITLGRLVVTDSENAEVRVYDLDDEAPAALATFSIAGPGARVYGAKHGRYFYALSREAGEVELFDSGLLFQSHVDHFHIQKSEPEALDLSFSGPQPTHFTYHDGWTAIFYDGSGEVDFIQERSISAGAPSVRRAATGQAHHGVAVVTHAHLLATVPTMDEFLPVGVDARAVTEPDEVEMEAMGCPSLHGEASAGDWTLFGCGDGVLALQFQDGGFVATKIENPDGTPEEVRVGTVAAHEESDVFFGNYGSLGLVRIDPAAGTMEPIMTDEQVASFTFDMHGETVLAWTVDGMLHRFDAATGAAVEDALEVTDPYEIMGHGSARPSVNAGGERVYVLDPAAGRVREIHLGDWSVERDIETGGTPFSMTVVSLSPDYAEEGHDHDHE